MAFPEERIFDDTHRAWAETAIADQQGGLDTMLGAILDHSKLHDYDKRDMSRTIGTIQQHLTTLTNQLNAVVRPASEAPPPEE
jgi:hypothetical protein